MHRAAERDLNLDIEWVHMAATLITANRGPCSPAIPKRNPSLIPFAMRSSSNSWRTEKRLLKNWPDDGPSKIPGFPERRVLPLPS